MTLNTATIRRIALLASLGWFSGAGLFGQCPSGNPPAVVTAASSTNTQATNCIQTSGTISVSGTSPVYYQAGSTIYLNTGFSAQAGSSGTAFLAQIAPVVTTTSIPAGVTGSAYPTTALQASEGSIASFFWSAAGFPANVGLSFSTAGIISGTPTTAGSWQISVAATDASGHSSFSQTLALTIASNLTITTSSLPGGVIGASYSQTLGASGGTGTGDNWSATGLPAGLNLAASTGVLSGTPITAGVSMINVTLADNGGNQATASLSLSISAPLTITTTSLSGGFANWAYSQGLTASGGSGALTWSLASGSSLPSGMTLSSAGIVSWQTPVTGNYSFSATVTDSGSPEQSVTKNFSLSVSALPNPLISVNNPAGGTCCWGVVDLTGYALENTPALRADRISKITITLSSQDDTGLTINDTATYGDGTANSICSTATYSGGTDCPNVQFDYLWKTGTANLVNPWLNGVYSVTFIAFDSSAPPLSTSTQPLTLTVDNQPPSPVIVSPVNGSGLPGVSQPFTILYLSTHSNLDFGGGQVVFTGVNSNTCVVNWTMAGNISLQSTSTAPSPCTLDNSALSNNGSDELTLKLWVTFPSAMAGGVSVQASGLSSGGEQGPLSTITNFTVTTASGALPMPQPWPVEAGITSNGGAVTVSQTIWIPNPGLGTIAAYASSDGCSFSSSLNLQPTYLGMSALGYPMFATASAPNGNLVTVTATFTATDSNQYDTLNGLTCKALLYVFEGTYGNIVGTGEVDFTINPYSPGFTPLTAFSPNTAGALILTQSVGSSASINMPGLGSGLGYNPATLPGGIGLSSSGTTLTATVTNPAIPPGTYALEFEGVTSAGLQNATLFITVTPVTPTISISPVSPVSLAAGGSTTFTVSVSPVNGYSGTVNLAQVANPNNATITLAFNPSSLNLANGPQVTTATISAQSDTPVAPYSVSFSASDSSSNTVLQKANVPLNVQGGPAASYSSAVSPSPVALSLGQSTTANLILTPGPGFSGVVTATITMPQGQAGLAATFAGASSQATVNLSSGIQKSLPIYIGAGLPITASGCPSCSFVVTITGGNVSAQPVTVSVPVGPPLPLIATVQLFPPASNYPGGYPIGQQIWFIAAAPDGSVGGETFAWSALVFPTPETWAPVNQNTTNFITLTPTASGLYCAMYTVTDGLGRTATSPQYNGCAQVVAGLGVTVSGATSTTVGKPVTLTANASGGSGSYSYAWTNASPASNPAIATFNPTATGLNQVVTVIVTDTTTHNTVTASTSINVYQALTVTITGNAPTTVGQSLALTATAIGGSGSYTYSAWTGAAASQTSPNMATFNATTTGNQTVTVVATDGAGNTATGSTQISVSPASSLGVNLNAPTTAATQTQLTLTAQGVNGSGNYTYQWSVGGNGATISYTTPAVVGTYTVSVTVTDTSTNATSTTGRPIRVLPPCATATLPSHEYIWLGGQVIAVEIPSCATTQ